MIINILIPRFWIVVEERRRPEFQDRPVIIGASLLEKTAARSSVLMANDAAEQCGIQAGMSLAHARQMCPEVIVLSPELPLYQGVWDTVVAALLTFTPLVQSLGPGEAVCDVTGCERLFGAPASMAREIVERIEEITGLPAIAGVGTNVLVARLAAQQGASRRVATSVSTMEAQRTQSFAEGEGQEDGKIARTPRDSGGAKRNGLKACTTGSTNGGGAGEQDRARGGNAALRDMSNLISFRARHYVIAVEPGTEAAFLAPLPVTLLPEIDPDILLSFQVLGLKTIGHLAAISETAMASRFGPLGKRLAQYASGQDNRRVQPVAEQFAVWVSRRCDDDETDGLEPEQAISQLLDRMAAELSDALKRRHLAGKLIMLTLRVPRSSGVEVRSVGRMPYAPTGEKSIASPRGRRERGGGVGGFNAEMQSSAEGIGLRLVAPPPSPTSDAPVGLEPPVVPNIQFFPNQDSRIHSMLPTPRQPSQESAGKQRKSASRKAKEREAEPEINNQDPVMVVKTMAHMVIGQPINDHRSLVELANRLLVRIMSTAMGKKTGKDAINRVSTTRMQSGSKPKRLTRRSERINTETLTLQAGLRELLAEPGGELRLEMRHFAPPEQLALPGLDGKPIDIRLNRIHRQEAILAARFGSSPFRHITAINLDSVLQERRFQWGIGQKSP